MLKVNYHLLKKGPVYSVKNKPYEVKLLKVIQTDKGLCFTAEIVTSPEKQYMGSWTSVYKKDLI